MTTPPYGQDPYALPPGNPAQPPGYPAYGQPYGQDNPYGSPSGYGQPASVPPVYGQPGSVPPVYGQPGSVPPVYGQPASVPPVSGLPQPYSPYAAGYTVPTPVPMTVPVNYGYDPVTGQPYSEKSKVVAGLLQLLLGALLGLGGVGRTYAGNIGLGVTQICLSLVGWGSFWCGFFLIVPWFITVGLWVWFVVDGIIMLAGRPVDGQGRLLRS